MRAEREHLGTGAQEGKEQFKELMVLAFHSNNKIRSCAIMMVTLVGISRVVSLPVHALPVPVPVPFYLYT